MVLSNIFLSAVEITFIVIMAIALPLIFAVVAGYSAWSTSRVGTAWGRLRKEYARAVGLEPSEPSTLPSGQKWPGWLYVLCTGAALRYLPDPVSFALSFLIVVVCGVGALYCAFRSYQILRRHPELEPRLKWVPRTEMALFSVVAALFLITLYVTMIWGGAPY